MSGDRPLIVTDQDSGREAAVPPSGLVELHLQENPTTGFRWELPDIAGVEVIEDRNERSSAAVGAGSVRVLRLRITGKGVKHLRLTHKQAWEPDRAEDAIFELDLRVPGTEFGP